MMPELPVPEQYQLRQILGRGSFGQTFLAFDTLEQKSCVIKQLSLRHLDAWKTLELFEREARVLAHLDHPGIPRFMGFYSQDPGQDHQACLVQEYISGQTLKAQIESGKRYTESEIMVLATELLGILVYLQQFSPPVIHRDIKPSNIILAETGKPILVDFGAVSENLLHKESGGSTIVGTFGYMPIEQLDGRAVPGSDLFALGVTLIYALSGLEPGRLEKENLSLNFRPYVQISVSLCRWLDKMIHPDWKQRFHLASEALEALRNPRAASLSELIVETRRSLPAPEPIQLSDFTLQKRLFVRGNLMLGLVSSGFSLSIHSLSNPLIWVFLAGIFLPALLLARQFNKLPETREKYRLRADLSAIRQAIRQAQKYLLHLEAEKLALGPNQQKYSHYLHEQLDQLWLDEQAEREKLARDLREELEALNSELGRLDRQEADEMHDLTQNYRARFVKEELQKHVIGQARIPGVGNVLQSRLLAAGIRSAADIASVQTLDLGGVSILTPEGGKTYVEGIGQAKGQSLLDWRRQLETSIRARMPLAPPKELLKKIHDSYLPERQSLERKGADIKQKNKQQVQALPEKYSQLREKLTLDMQTSPDRFAQESSALDQRFEAARRTLVSEQQKLAAIQYRLEAYQKINFMIFLIRALVNTH
ncbi:MAG: protein kinase [Candidatus Sericytochromatia bacterium]